MYLNKEVFAAVMAQRLRRTAISNHKTSLHIEGKVPDSNPKVVVLLVWVTHDASRLGAARIFFRQAIVQRVLTFGWRCWTRSTLIEARGMRVFNFLQKFSLVHFSLAPIEFAITDRSPGNVVLVP